MVAAGRTTLVGAFTTLTFTAAVAPLARVARMVVVSRFTPVTTPLASTLAILTLSEVQVTAAPVTGLPSASSTVATRPA